jgi:hypothetical protein
MNYKKYLLKNDFCVIIKCTKFNMSIHIIKLMISLKDHEEQAENVSIITYKMDNINTNKFSQ